MFTLLSEWVNINRAKILQSTEQALVGVLKAPTLTSAVCRLCCRRSYVWGPRPPFSADNAPPGEFRMHTWNPSSCFLRDASSLIDADGQVSATTYKCASLGQVWCSKCTRPPLNWHTLYKHIPKELDKNIPTVWASFEFSGTLCQSRHFYSPTQLDLLRKRPDG